MIYLDREILIFCFLLMWRYFCRYTVDICIYLFIGNNLTYFIRSLLFTLISGLVEVFTKKVVQKWRQTSSKLTALQLAASFSELWLFSYSRFVWRSSFTSLLPKEQKTERHTVRWFLCLHNVRRPKSSTYYRSMSMNRDGDTIQQTKKACLYVSRIEKYERVAKASLIVIITHLPNLVLSFIVYILHRIGTNKSVRCMG